MVMRGSRGQLGLGLTVGLPCLQLPAVVIPPLQKKPTGTKALSVATN